MNTTYFRLFFALLSVVFASGIASAQTTYTWNNTSGGDWTVSTNWTPTRTAPAASDVLQFNNGGTYTVTAIPAQTVGQLFFTNSTKVTFSSAASRILTISGPALTDNLIIANGSSLSLTSSASELELRLGSNQFADISGQLNVNANTRFRTNNNATPRVKVKATGSINHYAGLITSDATTLAFEPGGTYEYKGTGSFTVPTATWDVASNVIISGIQSGGHAGLNQNFGNFLWDAAGQTADVTTSSGTGFPTNVRGTFEVRNTNGYIFTILSNNSSTDFTWSGNLVISGGRFAVRTNPGIATTLTVNNFTLDNTLSNKAQLLLQNSSSYDIDFTVNGNTQITLPQNSTNTNVVEVQTRGNIYLKGNLTQTGTGTGKISRSGTPTTSFNFSGSGTQTVTLDRTDLFGTFSTLNFNTAGTVAIGTNTIAPTTAVYIVSNATTVNITSGAISAGGNFTLNGILNIGTGSVSNSGTFTVNSGATLAIATGKVNNTGNFTLNSGSTISIGSPHGISAQPALTGNVQNASTTRTFNTGANYIYTGADGQITGTGLPTGNISGTFTLNLNAATARLSPTNNISLTKAGVGFVLTQGILLHNDKHITLASGTTITGGSVNSFVATNSTGEFRKAFATGVNTAFTYPLGDVTGTFDYSPAVLTLTAATGAITFGARVTNDLHPNRGSLNVLNRYWSFSVPSGTTDYTYSAQFTSAAADGTPENSIRYTGTATNWTTIGALSGSPFTVASNKTSNALTSDFTATAVCSTIGEWTGAISTDWNTQGNWSCNTLPTATTDVTIPNVSNKPTVPVAGASAKDIIVADGVTVTLNGYLHVNGDIRGGATSDAVFAGAGELILGGTLAQSIAGEIQVGQLSIDNTFGVTALGTANVKVIEVLKLRNGNFINSAGTITLRSTASQTAYLDNFSAGNIGTYVGDITVEQYVSNTSDGYRDISSPVASTVADWAADFSVFGQDAVHCWFNYNPYPNLQEYIENSNSVTGNYNGGFWSYTGGTRPLVAGKGFAARLYNANNPLPLTFSTTGVPYNGNQSIAITKTITSEVAADGWNLIGNPYPSPIKWSSLKALNSGKTDGSYYVFRTTGEFTRNWGVHNGVTGVNGATDIISSSQGFFVRASGNHTFNFANSIRQAEGDNVFFKATDMLTDEIRLTLSNGTQSDEIVAYTDANGTSGYDTGYDALKNPAGSTAHIGFVTGGNEYAINVLNAIDEDTELPLYLQVQDTGAYTLNATELNVAPLTAYLKDAENNTYHNLNQSAAQLQLFGGNAYADKYSIVFKTNTTGIDESRANVIKIYSNGRSIFIHRDNEELAEISISNMLGQQIAKYTVTGKHSTINDAQLPSGYAIVKVKDGTGTQLAKVFIQQ